MHNKAQVKALGMDMLDQLMALKTNERGKINGDEVIDVMVRAVGPIIGERVRIKREELMLSQGDLAAALRTTQPEISKIEQGQRAINIDTAKNLAAALRVTPHWILTGK